MPKKRDNIERAVHIPDSFYLGVKKQGPTVKELQEEYGGAGVFYIPLEEHYILDKEEWRYDNPPLIYKGKNVADFYDPDIERKLEELEKEEDIILAAELEENKLMDVEEANEFGVTEDDLQNALKEVRGKKAILKMQHKLKKNQRAKSKNKNIKDLEEHLDKLGLNPNKESLEKRVKKRRTLANLEDNQDKLAKKIKDDESADDNAPVNEERTGRKRKRSLSDDSDDDMDEEEKGSVKQKKVRSLTPVQLKSRA